ncbi:MAG: GyrI-like domain-containing protein [Armatimonadetes bacterium]|nr:GyrI-like domain-containing protein [Armatimonadota bacterium]
MLQPSFTDRDAFWVLGIQERANPMQVDYPAFWARFEQRLADVQPLATGPDGYGVYFPIGEPDVVDVFGGVAVLPGAAAPEGLVLREVPGGQYAVFECTMQAIGQTWGTICGEWAPASDYDVDHTKPCFEHFPPGCHEGTEPVRIFVPVRRKV